MLVPVSLDQQEEHGTGLHGKGQTANPQAFSSRRAGLTDLIIQFTAIALGAIGPMLERIHVTCANFNRSRQQLL